jgi:hypothetical protein
MLITQEVLASVNGPYFRHYEEKGYVIPRMKKQKYEKGANGNLCKAGTCISTENRKILVKVLDLPPTSHYPIQYRCDKCGEVFTVGYNMYRRRRALGDLCKRCATTKDHVTSHERWVKKLIIDNPYAQCDISGENDKRFLVLHHLEGRGDNKNNFRDGYVIISANYHVAFHKFLGSTRVRSTREKYLEFKQREQESLEGGREYELEADRASNFSSSRRPARENWLRLCPSMGTRQ